MPSPPLPPSHKGTVGLFTLCSIMKVRAVGNRLSFPICTSTQRKSKCISEMVSLCLKLDNKWADLHARRARRGAHVRRKHNSYTPDTDSEAERARLGLMGKRRREATFPPGSGETALLPLFFPTRACQRERCDQFPRD